MELYKMKTKIKTQTVHLSGMTVLLLFLVGFMLPGMAQQHKIGQGGLAFSAGMPQGDFEQTLNDNGFGISGNLMFNLGNSPFALGAEVDYLTYGSETRNVPFSTTIPDVRVDVETNNNILQGHLLLRAQNSQGFLRPYADGLLGFKYLFTETSVRDEDDFSEEDEIASSTNFDDFAFSYGFGGGLMFRLHEYEPNIDVEPHARPLTILLDVRMRYLLGGQAEYLKRGDLQRIDGEVVVNPVESETDLMTFNIGVSFQF